MRIIRNIYFKWLFYSHKFLVLIGIRKNPIIKIWYDEETQNTCMYVSVRSGVYRVPVGRKTEDARTDDGIKKVLYSYWLASFTCMYLYSIPNNGQGTIYTLQDVD